MAIDEARLREKLIEKLGLPADSDDAAIDAELDARIDKAAEAHVAAAIAGGKILAAHRDYWLDAFRANWHSTSEVLASLSPKRVARAAPTPPVDADMANVHARITGVDFAPGTPDGIQVTPVDEMNAQINADPELQRVAWKLGIRDGINRPPEVFVTQPAVGKPKHRLVEHGDGTAHWETPTADF
ncbi:hypothetical protein [Mycobacterium palustre]|uniref:Uncharacterized protein n=1 Tax=Mycobacterium palustre TaxID=153971 RepID=A0A1X1ZVK5_9MYCO|nr:hypothetical protein [Mycobacterium palustre]MCV7101534.1 hypothetical protein [Mycobacterium palustre]ORW28177.1 hypothetical protein AWC19_27465 [Mycobacterium palustre]